MIIFNSSPDDKIIALSKFKGFADNNLHVFQSFKFVSHGG